MDPPMNKQNEDCQKQFAREEAERLQMAEECAAQAFTSYKAHGKSLLMPGSPGKFLMVQCRDDAQAAFISHACNRALKSPIPTNWKDDVVSSLAACAAAGEITASDVRRALDRFAPTP